MLKTLEVEQLTGADTKTIGAFLNAVRANGSFSIYCEHFNNYLSDFFHKCFIEKDEVKKDLSIIYITLSIKELKEIFKEVYEKRKQELSFLLELKEYEYDKLDELEQIKYNLIYYFGDKIGGYPAIASLNPEETLKLYILFCEKAKKEKKSLEEMNKKSLPR